MHADYYINTIYPLQDKILRIIETLPVGFYLTGGTALSRGYLNHRYSDDLDFFVNASATFKDQVELIFNTIKQSLFKIEIAVTDEDFARFVIHEEPHSLKLDFVNDVPFRSGSPFHTPLFERTDTILNILSNKVTALGRYSPKDVVDIVYICRNFSFQWETIMKDASEKDMWVNPVVIAEVLEGFPAEKLNEISWIGECPPIETFKSEVTQIISDLLQGTSNTLLAGL